MTDPYPLRTLRDGEFPEFAHAVSAAYGNDLRDADIADGSAIIELDRTIVAHDGDVPIAGAASYRCSLTIPGAVQPIAAVTWVGVAPTHRRRGILTSMMRRQLHGLYESGAEPIAVLNASEATIYGRYGYGIASRLARVDAAKTELRFRSDVDFGAGTIRLLRGDAALPSMKPVYDRVRGAPSASSIGATRSGAPAATTPSTTAAAHRPSGSPSTRTAPARRPATRSTGSATTTRCRWSSSWPRRERRTPRCGAS